MLNKFSYVEEHYMKSASQQLREIWKLWRKNRITPIEYFDMGLYNKKDPDNFIGLVQSKNIWKRYNTKPEIGEFINNKWKFYHKFMDLPTPPTWYLPCWTDTQQYSRALEDLYERSRRQCIFVKPVDGYGGNGAKVLNRQHSYAFMDRMFRYDVVPTAYVYQPALEPHPVLAKFTGSNAIGALRVITLVRQPDVIEIIGAFTKFVGVGNIVDYTSKPGNYLVSVDTSNWTLTTASTNAGLNTNVYPVLNGHKVYGTKIPVGEDFDEEIYRWVSEVHNKLELETSLIGWDIAVTEDGIFCLEANLKPGFASLQKADGKGYLHALTSKNGVPNYNYWFKSFGKSGLTTSWKTR